MELKGFAHGIAIERWSVDQRRELMGWLYENFPKEWQIEWDYDLESVLLTDRAYTAYLLRWA